MDVLNRGMLHILGRTKQDGKGFNYTTQNDVQFRIYELFISGIFPSILLELS
jgi:hypothetical protein